MITPSNAPESLYVIVAYEAVKERFKSELSIDLRVEHLVKPLYLLLGIGDEAGPTATNALFNAMYKALMDTNNVPDGIHQLSTFYHLCLAIAQEAHKRDMEKYRVAVPT